MPLLTSPLYVFEYVPLNTGSVTHFQESTWLAPVGTAPTGRPSSNQIVSSPTVFSASAGGLIFAVSAWRCNCCGLPSPAPIPVEPFCGSDLCSLLPFSAALRIHDGKDWFRPSSL